MPALDRPDVNREDIIAYIRETRNWGRWGDTEELGALNLIDAHKRRRAAKLVRTGQAVSLSRPVPNHPAPNNPTPGIMYMERFDKAPDGGGSMDYQGMRYHGSAATHIDALCHAWDDDGMWGGRNPDDEISIQGAKWGSIDTWRNGILTRGVLLDIPAYRGTPYVTNDEPVHGWELKAVAEAQGVTIEPGDAIAIYSGREAYEKDNGPWSGDPTTRPGLEATCLQFIHETDCAALLWDMWDTRPTRYGTAFTTHAAIYAYGVAVIDSALLEPLSATCHELGTFEFMLTVNPLYQKGATGSLANPVAVF